MSVENPGAEMMRWAKDLFPYCRSITGPGVRQTLQYLQQIVPGLAIREVASGTAAFDWVVPDEWTISDAFVADENGRRVIDFRKHNLHVVSYSEPVNCRMSREDLDKHLHSLPHQPTAIPYVTSYYKRNWGFCLSHNERLSLPPGDYQVVIDSSLKPGVLNYGELLLPGASEQEVFLSTNVCHPSMGNNEISGPVVTAGLAKWLQSLAARQNSYRIVFLPETIGSIVYLSRHLREMRKNIVAGFNVVCVGDDRAYSYLPSRRGDTLADRVAKYVLDKVVDGYNSYSFLDRGSDERQYCSPLVDLPVASIMRSKYGTYPEYHTSLDDLSVISPTGLAGAYLALKECLRILEANRVYRPTVLCEPQLGKRGLYPSQGAARLKQETKNLMNLLMYADGEVDLLGIANRIGLDFFDCDRLAQVLLGHQLLVEA